MALAVGTRLGPYEIAGSIGAGGMGEVYRAVDTRLRRTVAIKVLLPERTTPEDRSRFEREARAIASLSHPHICTLHDIGEHESSLFLVMEWLEGETLAARLRAGPLPLSDALGIGMQIAGALAAAHGAGFVHRDLKPGNIMLTPTVAKLLDFGLARPMRGGAVGARGATARTSTAGWPLTAAGMIVGTLHYMSPEQVDAREADSRSDIWALGCVLYEMTTGRPAFDGGTPASVISSILKDEPQPLTNMAPATPLAYDRLVRACLVKDPDQRWQSAQDVLLALRWLAEQDRVASDRSPRTLAERRFVLTAEHVRGLSARNPRLVGYPVTYLDNGVDSDQLVVLLHGIGTDAGCFEGVLRRLARRAVAVTLAGFGRRERNRPELALDDHSRVLRLVLRSIVADSRPARTVLVGFSAGADQILRMLDEETGAGVEIAGLLALGPNVSLETCFASRLFAKIDASDPAGTLASLKTLAQDLDTLETWLVVQNYLSQMFIMLGSEVGPLRRYAADLVTPFEHPGDPLAHWYRTARRHIPCVRLVFSNEEAAAAEALLARHLETNVLGTQFTEESFVFERVHHLRLLEPDLILRHLEEMLG